MFAPEPPVDDLSTSRGVVLSRAATILRSIETQPLTGGSSGWEMYGGRALTRERSGDCVVRSQRRRQGKVENRLRYACVLCALFRIDSGKRPTFVLYPERRGTPITLKHSNGQKMCQTNPVLFFSDYSPLTGKQAEIEEKNV